MAESKLTIKIASDVSEAVNGIKSVNKNLDDMAKAASGVGAKYARFSSILGGVSIAMNMCSQAVSKVSGAVKESVELYSVQEQAEIKLASTLKATQNAIGMSASELYALASAFQEVTTFGDEAIIGVEQLFVATGKMTREALEPAIEATLDMSAALGTDLSTSARTLARVLADPASNLETLKSVNIQFNESQKEQIKNLQASGNLWGAQSIVLESIAASYGGIAKSVAETDTGKITQIKNVYGDIKEGLGKSLLNTISPALDVLYGQLVKISAWVYENTKRQDIIKAYKNNEKYDFSEMDDTLLLSSFQDMSWKSKTGMGTQKTVATKALADIITELEKRNLDYPGRRYLSEEDLAKLNEVEKRLASNRFGIKLNEHGGTYSKDWLDKGIKAGMFTMDDFNSYWSDINTKGKLEKRERDNKAATLKKTADANTNASNGTQSATEGSAVQTSSLQDFIAKNRSLSITAQIAEYEKQIEDAKKLQNTASDEDKGILDEIIKGLEDKKNLLTATDELTASEYINSNKSLSIIAQQNAIEEEIAKAQGLKVNASANEQIILDEIIASLEKEKNLLEATDELTAESYIEANSSLSLTAQRKALEDEMLVVKGMITDEDSEQNLILKEILDSLEDEYDALDGVEDRFASITDSIREYGSATVSLFSSIGSAIDASFSSKISDVDKKLAASEKAWEKTLSEMNEDEDMQKDSLAHLYDEGLISAEQYEDSIKNLYDNKKKAEEEAMQEQEELQKKEDELKKKQFYANKSNQLAQATINGAMAISSIWASHAANPIMAGILTGLSVATTAAQIATISASNYTPMATGGIVTKPTYALLGEAGHKEAVLPLTDTNMKRAGLAPTDNGVINLSINIGTSFTGSQLAEDVYKGIERAQRTGLLPKWRYA